MKFKISNYQRSVLKNYRIASPSRIYLKKNYNQYKKDLKKVFFEVLKVDKNFFYNKNILDLGCGTGETDIILKKFGARKITGVDFNNKSITEANYNKKIFKENNIKFIYNSIISFNTKKKFDIILIKGVLPHLSPREKLKVLMKYKKNLNKDGYFILSFLDSAGNLNKLFQQISINKFTSNLSADEKFIIAKNVFGRNFKRFTKYGFRKSHQVFYDYISNIKSYGTSYLEVIKKLKEFEVQSSYPLTVNDINYLPIKFFKNKITDYNHFFLQQLHWVNNKSKKNNVNLRLFEKYEDALKELNIKKIKKISRDINLYKNKLLFDYSRNLNSAMNEFNALNKMVEKVLNANKNKINTI